MPKAFRCPFKVTICRAVASCLRSKLNFLGCSGLYVPTLEAIYCNPNEALEAFCKGGFWSPIGKDPGSPGLGSWVNPVIDPTVATLGLVLGLIPGSKT